MKGINSAQKNPLPSSLFRRARAQKILRSELNAFIEMLSSADVNLVKFGAEVARHPQVVEQLLRSANSSLTGSLTEIREPTHATLLLGSRRVIFLLNTLPPEIIEEDLDDVAPTE